MTGWGVVIEILTHDNDEQRRYRRQRALRREAARGTARRAGPVRTPWSLRPAAVCTRAYAIAGPSA